MKIFLCALLGFVIFLSTKFIGVDHNGLKLLSIARNYNSPENTFIVNGVPDLGDSEIMHSEDDAVALDTIFRVNNENSANIISVRRFGKKRASTQNSSGSQGSSPTGSQGVQCRPLLVSCNPWLLRECLGKSYKLQDYEQRIFSKKYLTSSERSVEKKLLEKRFELLQSGEYERKQFRIRKLELFYNGVKIPVDGTARLSRFNILSYYCQSLCGLDRRKLYISY